VNRNQAITILCAFAVSVAPDVIDAITATLPGKKKAKVCLPFGLSKKHFCGGLNATLLRTTQHTTRQALEQTFREVLPLLSDKGYSGDDTGEDSDEDRL
jgi:hypothetical protein